MAEEEEKTPPSGENKKISADWKKMPKWEKAGVVIAGATLVFMIIIWFVNRNQAGNASNQGYNGYLPGFAGSTQSNDMYPALQTGQNTQGNGENPQQPIIPVGSTFNTVPQLLGNNVNIFKGTTGDWLARWTNPGSNSQTTIDLSKQYPGINVFAGGNGQYGQRFWYTLPGYTEQQALANVSPGGQGH